MFCTNEALELSANFCLEVAWDHIIWYGVCLSYGSESFCNQLCLVCWRKWGDDLFYHCALAKVVMVVSCMRVFLVSWQSDCACSGLSSVLAYTRDGSWGGGVNVGV